MDCAGSLQVNPDGLATVFGTRRRTWRETGERVARLAAGFRALGVNAGDRIAILSLNSDRYLEVYLATGWAGGVVVPLNIRWSQLENEDAMRDCRARVLLVDRAFAPIAAALATKIDGLTLVYADDGEVPRRHARISKPCCAGSDPMPDAMRDSSDLAGIFYTGGTTGRSKGVMLSHGNLMANAMNALAEGLFAGSAVYLHAAPMFHLANGAAMYSILLSGGSNVIVPGFTPEGVMAAFQNERVTDVLLVPTMIQILADHPALGSYDTSSVRKIVYGASPISEAVLDRAISAFPNAQFTQAYGMTELAPIATLLHWNEHIGSGRARNRHRSAGRASLACEVRIVDSENNPVPCGTVGEIIVRGDNVMMGYWAAPGRNRPGAIATAGCIPATAAISTKTASSSSSTAIKDMIISGGENVYSTEVENALASIRPCPMRGVIGIPSEQWGEQVHAVVVPKPDAEVDAASLIAFCKERIAGYKCPRSVEIRGEPLPLSGAGKILKRELRQPYWENRQRMVS